MKNIMITGTVAVIVFLSAIAAYPDIPLESHVIETLVSTPNPPSIEPRVLETLTDRCKTSVRIEPSLIYDPDKTSMVPGHEAPIRLKRPNNENASTVLTDKRTVGLLLSGRFRWFCGPTADNKGGTPERSRCPKGTNALRAKLGPDRLLEIQCLGD
jgi:hypothetical protein